MMTAREGEDVLTRRATVTFGQMHAADPKASGAGAAAESESEVGRDASAGARPRGVTVAAPRVTIPHDGDDGVEDERATDA